MTESTWTARCRHCHMVGLATHDPNLPGDNFIVYKFSPTDRVGVTCPNCTDDDLTIFEFDKPMPNAKITKIDFMSPSSNG